MNNLTPQQEQALEKLDERLTLKEVLEKQAESAAKLAEIQKQLPVIEENLKYWQGSYWSAWGALRIIRAWMEGNMEEATLQSIYDMVVREMDGE